MPQPVPLSPETRSEAGAPVPSITVMVIVTLVTVSTLVLGAFGFYNYQHEREYRWTKLQSDLRVNADQMAAGLALPVWNIDRQQIDKVIESFMSDRNIYGVIVTAAGKQHIRTRDKNWNVISTTDPFPTEGLEQQTREIRASGEAVGVLCLYVTAHFIEHDVNTTLISSLVTIAAFDILLTLGIYLLLWRNVLKPLREVEIFAGDVSAGAIPEMPESGIRFGRELASLKSSIEKMVRLLDSRYSALQEIASAHREAEEEIRVSHDRLSALTERLTSIREDEKTKLAHEIHDEFGQVLSAMKMDLAFMARKLQAAEAVAPNPQLTPLLARVDALTSTIDNTIVKIRQIAIDLRPDLLDNLGLVEAVNWYAEEFQRRSGLLCSTNIPDHSIVVPPEQATALFRITQEALTNVARHSGATQVTISLVLEADELRLSVGDNGRGINPSDMVKPTSMGVLGMRMRVLRFNGDCTIIGAPGEGTTVVVRIPQTTTQKPEIV